MNKTIYLFGTFGDLKGLPSGGGQTSARRLWHNLDELGFHVEITNRHRFVGPKTAFHKIKTIGGMILDTITWFCKLLFGSRMYGIAMAIGYGGVMAPLDSTIMRIASFLGYKSVFYLKGGGTEKMYDNGTLRNKRLFKKTLQNSNIVFTEGKENVTLVNKVTNGQTKVCYIPNFIEKGFFPTKYPTKPSSPINILYFGRIDESKNVKLIVEIFNLVAAHYPQTTITIIGKQGTPYANEVDSMINVSPYKSRITRLGHSSHDELAKVMATQHIFLFPSNEDREGHSNALNEAMAWGLVPVVSNNNFLPSIVGDESLVAIDNNALTYVRIISDLIDNNLISEKSKQMYQRVKDNFTQSVVDERLIKELNNI